MDCAFQAGTPAREKFHAVFDTVDGSAGCEFTECDGRRGVETTGVDPGLDCIEVYLG